MDNQQNAPSDNGITSEPPPSREGWDSTGTVNMKLKSFYDRYAIRWISLRELKADDSLPIPDYFPPITKLALLFKRYVKRNPNLTIEEQENFTRELAKLLEV